MVEDFGRDYGVYIDDGVDIEEVSNYWVNCCGFFESPTHCGGVITERGSSGCHIVYQCESGFM